MNMTADEMQEKENNFIMQEVKRQGVDVTLEQVEAVMDAFSEYVMSEEYPKINEAESRAYVLDKLMFEKGAECVTNDLLQRIDALNVEYMKSVGLVPEDWEEEE